MSGLLVRTCLSLLLVSAWWARAIAGPVSVTVLDADSGQPVAGAVVAAPSLPGAQQTDANGRAFLTLPSGAHDLTARCLGYAPFRRHLVLPEGPVALTLRLTPSAFELPSTEVRATRQVPEAGHLPLPIAVIRQCPDPSPDPVRFVKILPGVSSGNDQSSAYRFHGGAPGDNLLRLNGIELVTPLQVRHGLTEALSLVNPDLLDQADFYAGHVPVRYGDRLGAVLDAWYRRPTRGPGASFHLSTVQQSLAIQHRSGRHWQVLSGWRRADLGRLASGLQVSGRYRPRCWDGQTLLVWTSESRTEVALFGAHLHARYALAPTAQTLLYNCGFIGCDRFSGEGQGEESFGFDTSLLGLRTTRHYPRGEIVAFASLQRHQEQEDTDLAYLLRWQPKTAPMPSTAQIRSTEQYISDFEVWRGQAGVQLRLDHGIRTWEAGLGWLMTDIEGWTAGISRIASATGVDTLAEVAYEVARQPTDLYLYGQCRVLLGPVTLTPAMRVSRFGATGSAAILPRCAAEWMVRQGWTLGVAVDRQAQAPQFGELAAAEPGAHIQAQQAKQATFWLDGYVHPALAWRTEAHYRTLSHLMPYAVDDVRVVYSGRSDARGRSYGWTTAFRGQLGPATGMLSYSYLVAREDLTGDGRGEVPGPGDQRHTFSCYLEDSMSPLRWGACVESRCHLRVLYGSGYPFTPKVPDPHADQTLGLVNGERHSRGGGFYMRCDVGLTQILNLAGHHWQLRQEIANLFDQYNAVSRTYLPMPTGWPVELRRSLGRRVYNLSVSTSFGAAR